MRLSVILLCFLCTFHISAQLFTEVPAGPPFEHLDATSIAFADVDQDGDQDLFISGRDPSIREDNHISILFLNDGKGNFEESLQSFEGVDHGSVAFGDFDKDGDQDLLITGRNNNGNPFTGVYRNDGQGNFTSIGSIWLEDVEQSAVAIADVNSDGLNDFIISGYGDSGIRVAKIYINKSNGTSWSFLEDSRNSLEGIRDGSVAFADVDKDGDQDLLTSGFGSSGKPIAKLYTNDGTGKFTLVANTPFQGVNNCSLAFADVNGDGSQDVLITGQTEAKESISQLYINNGSGTFSLVSGTPFIGVQKGLVTFADVDNDGDSDVLLKGVNIVNRTTLTFVAKVYTNNGQGDFQEMIGTPFEGVINCAAAFADVDADGDLDVVINGRSPSANDTKLYLNNGSGHFSQVKGTAIDRVEYSAVAAADVDGDLDLDLLITGNETPNRAAAKLYLNDGEGFYYEVPDTPFDGVHSGTVDFADVDGDNDQDLLITGVYNGDQQIAKLYLNDGMGGFSLAPNTRIVEISAGDVTFADLDGDSDLDLLISGQALDRTGSGVGETKLYLNDGKGIFTEKSGQPFAGVMFSAQAIGDINGDQHPDVVLTGYSNEGKDIAKWYTNDGNGSFSEVLNTQLEGVSRSTVTLADFDFNGTLDLLIGGTLYNNDGTGAFNKVPNTPFAQTSEGSVDIADVDLDGDPDVLITGNERGSQVSKLYLNDGQGKFSTTESPFEGVGHSSAIFLDNNRDGDQDVFLTGQNNDGDFVARLYENNSQVELNFSEGMTIRASSQMDYELADMDGDGDLDLLRVNERGRSTMKNITLHLNDGSGKFEMAPLIKFTPRMSMDPIMILDLDGDQDLDLFNPRGTRSGSNDGFYLVNEGDLVFTERNVPIGELSGGTRIGSNRFADFDVDGDGDLDFITSMRNNFIYLNDGTGTFSVVTDFYRRLTYRDYIVLEAGDFDNNGAADLIIGCGEYLLYFSNDGTGKFTEGEFPFPVSLNLRSMFNIEIYQEDLNGDGKLDVISFTRDSRSNGNMRSIVFIQIEDGKYSSGIELSFDMLIRGIEDFHFVDIDSDGDQDIVFSCRGYFSSLSTENQGQGTYLLINDGSGDFSQLNIPIFENFVGTFTFGDVDGDGDQDVFMSGEKRQDKLFFNSKEVERISTLYINNLK